jgi:hypothetical protein
MTTLNGVPLTADQQLKAIKAYGGSKNGVARHGSALRSGVGVGWQHTVSMGKAGGLCSRRHS